LLARPATVDAASGGLEIGLDTEYVEESFTVAAHWPSVVGDLKIGTSGQLDPNISFKQVKESDLYVSRRVRVPLKLILRDGIVRVVNGRCARAWSREGCLFRVIDFRVLTALLHS
jgi:hypothetical protein